MSQDSTLSTRPFQLHDLYQPLELPPLAGTSPQRDRKDTVSIETLIDTFVSLSDGVSSSFLRKDKVVAQFYETGMFLNCPFVHIFLSLFFFFFLFSVYLSKCISQYTNFFLGLRLFRYVVFLVFSRNSCLYKPFQSPHFFSMGSGQHSEAERLDRGLRLVRFHRSKSTSSAHILGTQRTF